MLTRPTLRPRRLLAPLLLLATALLGASAGPAAAAPGVSVRASLAYADGSSREVPVWSSVRVSVSRDGVPVAVDQPLPAGADASYFTPPRLVALDLDDDAEPEVVVDVQTAGYDCCRRTVLLRFDGRAYVPLVADWGVGGYRLLDVAGGPSPELITSDSRIPGLYGSDGPGPIRVLRFTGGRLDDVSTQAPDQVARDARRHASALRKARRAGSGADARAAVAASAIDLVRLGRPAEARRLIRRAARAGELRGSATGFTRRLERQMVRWGYARPGALRG